MTDKVFIDTNLIVYMFDKSEVLKHKKIIFFVNEMQNSCQSCISVQVLNEFINVITRKTRNLLSYNRANEYINTISKFFTVFPIDI